MVLACRGRLLDVVVHDARRYFLAFSTGGQAWPGRNGIIIR
jgi:hypothetical protein